MFFYLFLIFFYFLEKGNSVLNANIITLWPILLLLVGLKSRAEQNPQKWSKDRKYRRIHVLSHFRLQLTEPSL